MNQIQLNIIKRKINKFSQRAHVTLWHGGTRCSIEHRNSLKRSQIKFDCHHVDVPFPRDVFVVAAGNDIFLIAARMPGEVGDWRISPCDLYDQVSGKPPLYELEWEILEEVPTTLVSPVMALFQQYFGVEVVFPVLTIAVAARQPYETEEKGTVFVPNSALLPQEREWVVEMQRARIAGGAIPPRPEVLLGEKMRCAGLWEGIVE